MNEVPVIWVFAAFVYGMVVLRISQYFMSYETRKRDKRKKYQKRTHR
jgi:hypothetical protein